MVRSLKVIIGAAWLINSIGRFFMGPLGINQCLHRSEKKNRRSIRKRQTALAQEKAFRRMDAWLFDIICIVFSDDLTTQGAYAWTGMIFKIPPPPLLEVPRDIAFSHMGTSFCYTCGTVTTGVGVTKAPFVNFSVSKIFDLAKVPVRLFAWHSYLTGVAAAELRRHLLNMNMIFNR